MKTKILSLATVVSLLTTYGVLALAAYDVRMVGVVFDPGADRFETADSITGDESVMYRFRPSEGQVLRVRLNPDNDHTDFIVYAPGKWPGKVLHDSEASGSFAYQGEVDRTGPHAVSVFQTQTAVADEATSSFELVIEVADAAE